MKVFLREESAMPYTLKNLNIVCGHYGSGKTTFAVNLALTAKQQRSGTEIHIADLDIVNPYFRTADAAGLLRSHGIDAVLPQFANSNVDIPALPSKMTRLIESKEDISIIDVGGDDGAVALGMYAQAIRTAGYDLFFVVNAFRPLIADPADALGCMQEIEAACGLRCTKLVNNSCLGAETTADDLVGSVDYAHRCAEVCGIPLFCHTYPSELVPDAPEAFRKAGLEAEPLLPLSGATRKLF